MGGPQFAAAWQQGYLSDTSANSSAKTFTVPEKMAFQILNVHVSYATNGTAGDRLVAVEGLSDDDTVIYRTVAGVNQTASTTYSYDFNPNLPYLTSVRSGASQSFALVTLPLIVLRATYKLKVYDINAVDASGASENLSAYVSYLGRKIRT